MGRKIIVITLIFAAAVAVSIGNVLYKQISVRTSVQGALSEDFQKHISSLASSESAFTFPEIPELYLDLKKPAQVQVSKELILFQFQLPKSTVANQPPKEESLTSFQNKLLEFVSAWVHERFPKDRKKVEVRVEFI